MDATMCVMAIWLLSTFCCIWLIGYYHLVAEYGNSWLKIIAKLFGYWS
jgi:hypothetical protein